MSEKKRFEYTYASPERKVKAEPLPHPEILQAGSRKPVLISILLGTASCLIFGLGLTCVLEWQSLIPGCVLGALGIAGMSVGPAFYRRRVLRERKAEKHDNP